MDRAQKILRGDDPAPYVAAQERTRNHLVELVESKGLPVSNTRWDAIDPKTGGDLVKVFREQQAHRPFHQHLVRTKVIANSLLQEGEEGFSTPDIVIQELEISPHEEPINCLISWIIVEAGQKPSNVYFQVQDEEEQEVDFTAIPVASLTEGGEEIYHVQLFFTPPLPVSKSGRQGSYFVRTEFRIRETLPWLLKRDPTTGKYKDEVCSRVNRAVEVAEKVELEIHVPSRLAQSLRPQSAERATEGDSPITPCHQLNARERRWKAHFQPIVWGAENVPNGSMVVLEIVR